MNLNDLILLKRYLQNELDTGSHKMFIFDKDYNAIEFKICNALSGIEFIEKELDQYKNNWEELKIYILNHYIVGHTIQNASLDDILNKMKELEEKSND